MRIFISYAHVDKAIVDDWLVQTLRLANHDVWTDELLSPGQGWEAQLGNAIQESDVLIYAMTPESLVSKVCRQEVITARRLGKPILPVLMQARTSIPEWLGKIQYVDFSNGSKGDAVAKLLGGLQKLRSEQVPAALLNSTVAPALIAKTMDENPSPPNIMIKLLRDPAFQAITAVIGILLAIVAIVLPLAQPNKNETPTPTSAVVIIPTATVALCEGEVISTTGGMLNQVRLIPARNSQLIEPVQQGSKVTITDRKYTDQRNWYRISYGNNQTGWIPVDYVTVSSMCPA